MSECPCINCICFPACRGSNSITKLMDKCSILAKSLNKDKDVIEVIEVIKPSWYPKWKNDRDLPKIINNILQYSLVVMLREVVD